MLGTVRIVARSAKAEAYWTVHEGGRSFLLVVTFIEKLGFVCRELEPMGRRVGQFVTGLALLLGRRRMDHGCGDQRGMTGIGDASLREDCGGGYPRGFRNQVGLSTR